MRQTLRGWLARPYALVTGCALRSGIATGTIKDLRHWAMDGVLGLLVPNPTIEARCVQDYLATAGARVPGSCLIILTDLVIDTNLTQTRLVDRTPLRLYRQDLGAAIQLEAVPCAICPTTGNAALRLQSDQTTARQIAEQAQADVAIWGKV